MVPLFTIVFAAVALADEHITVAKLAGLGIGFVGVISGHDHDAADGELSGSVHLQPLLERSRGRIVATLADGHINAGEAHFDIHLAAERWVYAVGFVVSTSTPTC